MEDQDDVTRKLEHELRLDAEEAEEDAAHLAARSRRLEDVAFDSMSRGDLVMVTALGRSVSGVVEHAAGDLAIVVTDTAPVAVNLGGPIAIWVTRRSHAHGHGRTRGAASFAARLTEFEITGEQVEVIAPLVAVGIVAQITAVARDHVQLVTPDEHSLALPFTQIAFVAQHQ